MGEGRYNSTILDLGTGWGGEWAALRSGQFIPVEGAPVPILYEAEWAREPIRTLKICYTC
jgi:hypothetical protein